MTAPALALDQGLLDTTTDASVREALEAVDRQAEDQAQAEAARTGVGEELLGRPLTPREQDLLRGMYGDGFPLAEDQPTYDDWTRWAERLWDQLEPTVQPALLLADRNRRFRQGQQWLSRQGAQGPWREPPIPSSALRLVDNMIGPALELRQAITTEQRPGWRVKPTAMTPERKTKATAVQQAIEYFHGQHRMAMLVSEAKWWAQTDGIAYFETFWDPDVGPWGDLPTPAGSTAAMPLGDHRTRVRRIEQVRVDASATPDRGYRYALVRERIPVASALHKWGRKALEAGSTDNEATSSVGGEGVIRHGYEVPGHEVLLRNQPTTDRLVVYCTRSEFLPNGLTLVVIGGEVMYLGPLAVARPLIRVADRSTDPTWYARPNMEGWLDCQVRINMAKSKWIEAVRHHASGRLLARENAIDVNAIVTGLTTLVPVKDGRPLNDVVLPFPQTGDSKLYLDVYLAEKQRFEELSGYNEVSRGQFPSDASGRAILAVREQVERQFGPDVQAMAEAMVDWAKSVCDWSRWGYVLPRALGVFGDDRPDLAREFLAEDFDGVAEIDVDPETLMPMPRSLRLFLLEDQLTKGIISLAQYKRLHPFGGVANVETPDEQHFARAKRVVEALRQTADPTTPATPMLWQDAEQIHQDVLERDLILPDDTDPAVRYAAQQRWFMLAQQASMKAMMMAPPPAPAPGGGGSGPGKSGPKATASLDPRQQPLSGSNPSVSASPLLAGAGSDAQRLAGQLDGHLGR